MREPMQEPTLVDVMHFKHDVPISASARGRDNILVKGKGDKYDDDDEVDGGAHGAHALGDLGPVRLAQVLALEAVLDKRGAQPADHRVAEAKGDAAQGQRGDEGLAIAAKGVGEDGEARSGQGEEGERLVAR